MKKILRQLVFSLGFLSTPFLFSSAADSALSSSVFLLTTPAAALDVSDLDARDALNRPIKTSAAKRSFENLWTRHLGHLLLMGLTPARARMFEQLQLSWNSAKFFLGRWLKELQHKMSALAAVGGFGVHRLSRVVRMFPAALIVTTSSTPDGFSNDFLSLIIASTRLLR
jgi:hypothetical protein